MTDLQNLQNQIAEWADGTFGFNRPPISSLNHLREEVQELIESPFDRMEYADAFMLILDTARRAGYDTEELVRATFEKLEINRKRKWGKPNAEGYVKHID